MFDEPQDSAAKLRDLVQRGIEEADRLDMMIVAVRLLEIAERLPSAGCAGRLSE